ncbi:AraC family transcriptional regulator [Aliikangiella marina]|uniref:AraC family transcriptional regulator n=1 Tax=Aliikangiella marina TaxID=1712262 RepID=A0A545TI78_9GAMM|nr:AraC family transcriptional regulator [Aliikangiella marina]TQV76937.1 AraC family transcriptional regulator [Aliikangiella marina]
MRKKYFIYWPALVLMLITFSVLSENKADKNQIVQQEALETLRGISMGIQSLKDDVVTLNKDLRLMEEKLLFPSSTKYSVFVSMNSGLFFTLESVKLKIDGRLVATHIYSDKQREALARGGIHKLYITNLNQGKHTATAFFTGLGPNGRAYKLAKSLDFEKTDSGEYLELAVRDDGQAQEPVVFIKQW